MKLAEARILSDLAALGSAAFGDRPALLRGGDRPESALTYAQLEMAVDRAACDLASRGLRRGARVLLIAESGPSWLVTLLALGRAGLVAVPAPADAAVERLRHMAEHIGAGAVVVPQALIARRELPPHLALVTIEELLETGPRDRGSCSPSRADDLALLVFTSGSTSRPKAVALTHGNLLWNVRRCSSASGPRAMTPSCRCCRCRTCSSSSPVSCARWRVGCASSTAVRCCPTGSSRHCGPIASPGPSSFPHCCERSTRRPSRRSSMQAPWIPGARPVARVDGGVPQPRGAPGTARGAAPRAASADRRRPLHARRGRRRDRSRVGDAVRSPRDRARGRLRADRGWSDRGAGAGRSVVPPDPSVGRSPGSRFASMGGARSS